MRLAVVVLERFFYKLIFYSHAMLIFIDESGIHKKTDHSSFAVVYVAVENETAFNSGIERIESSLNVDNFHWADFGAEHGWAVRKIFVLKALKLPFCFKYTVVSNPIHPQKELNEAIVSLLTEDDIDYIYIDGKQPKWYERQIKKSLQGRGISVRKLKTVRDESHPAIRLADALANVVRLYHDSPTRAAKQLYERLRSKMKRNRPH